MLKKLFLYLPIVALLPVLASCTYVEKYFSKPQAEPVRAEIWEPKIAPAESVIVCRDRQCAPAKISMSREYIYNSLLHLLDNNTQQRALLCTANPESHVCTEEYLVMPMTIGITPAHMYINDVKITDVSVALNRKSIDLILNYNITFNGQTPTCKPAKTLVYVKNSQNIVMEDAGFSCKMTTIGTSSVKTLFAIDYIDLDYGYIGGYYSIGVSGPAFGGNSGYMLMRLPQNAYPLSPDLIYKEPEPEPEPEPVVEPAPAPAPVPAPEPVAEPAPEAPTTVTVTVTEEVPETQPLLYKAEPQPDPTFVTEGVQVFPLKRKFRKPAPETTETVTEKPAEKSTTKPSEKVAEEKVAEEKPQANEKPEPKTKAQTQEKAPEQKPSQEKAS